MVPRIVPRRLPLQTSLLDRLISPEPGAMPTIGDIEAPATVEQLRGAIRRDLETLLNTRLPWRSVPPGCSELERSLFGFGIPDITGRAFNRRSDRETIRIAVEDAIRRFEPRLTDIRVTLREDASLQSKLRLRIDALLMVQPAPQPYVVETTFTPPDSMVSLLDGKAREE